MYVLPPQPICLASLPTNPQPCSPSLCYRLSFSHARYLPVVLQKRSRKATIPFRITSFADPHPLTLIESHSYEKHQGGGGSAPHS